MPRLPKRLLFSLLRRHNIDQLDTLSYSQLRQYKFNDAQIQSLKNPNQQKIQANLDWQNVDQNKYIIAFDDPSYPPLLKEISNPPLLLYLQGDITLLLKPQIAIVGSRSCTLYGQQKSYQFAQQLSKAGFVISSGLAMGVDGFAHQGALDASQKTLAVLGSGLNNIYPKRHQALAQEIINKGLLVSEFWPDTPPLAANFPRRNRIISGLSLGVLVVEASKRSGSLITARYANEQNREVFALPGCIDNPQACGCHQLIQQGAKLITKSEDIFSEFQHLDLFIPQQDTLSSYLATHAFLLQHIDFYNTTLDQLLQRSGLDLLSLQKQLIELEIDGSISLSVDGYIKLKG
ncbi:DNA-processing protein DprA [Psychromonas sp. CNPT3]|uniref:DNA-processing protein DprA n=1 Tax=Psychromonas sp. CNPT3 TaxID=314282 RepID=UPI001E4EF9A3|nr:DNA-processing protein DprA [Psychromonas sp. CNPT3]